MEATIEAPRGMRSVDYSAIAEVVEAGKRRANAYLEHGYTLLGVYPFASLQHKGQTDFVQKSVFYVLGRTADVEPWAPEPEKPAGAQA